MKITYTQQEMQQHNARSEAIEKARAELNAANEKVRQAEMAFRSMLEKKPEEFQPSHGDVPHLRTDC